MLCFVPLWTSTYTFPHSGIIVAPAPHTLALGFGYSGCTLKLQVRLDPLLSVLIPSPFVTPILLYLISCLLSGRQLGKSTSNSPVSNVVVGTQ